MLTISDSVLRAVVFDLFGTLADWDRHIVRSPSLALCSLAVNDVIPSVVVGLAEGLDGTAQFEESAADPTSANRAWQRSGWREAMIYCGLEPSQDLFALLDLVVTRRTLSLYADVVAALTSLHRRQIPWVLCSNAAPDALEKLARALPEECSPHGIVASCTVGARKPHPRMLEEALKVCGVPANEAVFVGDRIDCDVVGPRAFGFNAVLVDRSGRRDWAHARRCGAIEVWRDLSPLFSAKRFA